MPVRQHGLYSTGGAANAAGIYLPAEHRQRLQVADSIVRAAVHALLTEQAATSCEQGISLWASWRSLHQTDVVFLLSCACRGMWPGLQPQFQPPRCAGAVVCSAGRTSTGVAQAAVHALQVGLVYGCVKGIGLISSQTCTPQILHDLRQIAVLYLVPHMCVRAVC
jgi:hypothetical protein